MPGGLLSVRSPLFIYLGIYLQMLYYTHYTGLYYTMCLISPGSYYDACLSVALGTLHCLSYAEKGAKAGLLSALPIRQRSIPLSPFLWISISMYFYLM